MSEIGQPGQPAPRVELGQEPTGAPVATSGFDLNHPTVISLLYLSSMVLGVTALVGLVLAYVWKGEAHAEWENSHYEYLIRTFWLGLIGAMVSVLLMIVLVGFLLMVAVGVLVVVRCVLSLINAQKHLPMPNPRTWLA
jgi:uncharacterized membrane protein